MNKTDLLNRTKQFAHDCVRSSHQLPYSILSNHIKGQLIRSGTSVAANYRAVCLAQSKASFISKISTVIEEALLPLREAAVLKNEAYELASIFIFSRKTAQNR